MHCKYYTLHTMYIKLHKLSFYSILKFHITLGIMDKKLNKIHENLIPMKLATIQYSTNPNNTIKHKHTI